MILRNKNGSYIVEAAIILPIFFIAIMALVGIIPIISTCENISFAVSEEIRMEMAKSAARSNRNVLPKAIRARVFIETKKFLTFNEKVYKYRFRKGETDDLIHYEFISNFKEHNPLIFLDNIKFSGSVTGRGFTGTYYTEKEGDGGGIVYIFPKDGICFHKKECTYVKGNCNLGFLNDEIKRKYKPCSLCHSKKAQYGSPIFYFKYGKSYHHGSCKSVDRYYIEISRDRAIDKGFVSCSKCGGIRE